MKASLLFLSLGSKILGQGFNFDEASNGDLSDDYTKPTILMVGPGSNVLEGTLTEGTNDLDLFQLVIPAGIEITSIRLLSFAGGLNGSYLLMMPGDILTSPPSNTFSDSIGYTSLTTAAVAAGDDLLPTITLPGLTGFPPFFGASSLTEGTYAGWLNETGAASTYTLGFEAVAIPVPEPSTSSLVLILAASTRLSRNRRES